MSEGDGGGDEEPAGRSWSLPEGVSDEYAEKWWDEVEFVDRFAPETDGSAVPSSLADEGEVCCRVCGGPVGGGREGLRGHLGGAHSMGLDEYGRQYPGAPLEPPENAVVDWADG